LTDRGQAQAAALGAALAAAGVAAATHDAWTSPQGRAAATARIALGPLGLTATPDPRLAEIGMGGWAGLTRAEIDRRWPGPPGEGLLAFYARAPGGEPLAALARRAAAVLAGLSRPAVLVTHGITLRVLLALALGHPPEAAEAVAVPQGRVARLAAGRLVLLPETGSETGPEPGPETGPGIAAGPTAG
jgi:probable phosphoglycerate mutase